MGVEEGQRVAHAIHAVLAYDAEKAHAAAQLHRACTGAAHLLDHLGLEALGGEAGRALFTRDEISYDGEFWSAPTSVEVKVLVAP